MHHKKIFHKEALFCGGGGSIPLCGFLNSILVTGDAGPDSNAQSYDELLNIDYTAKFE